MKIESLVGIGSALCFVAIAAVLRSAGGTAPQEEPPPAEFAWETDLAAANRRAAKEGKPLVVLFRCPP
ncbi:MAG: hypothetical protein CMJ83_08310 [Planctomycetes bacterium]|nr:hypothetical protein [Planctomycetota bacterium]